MCRNTTVLINAPAIPAILDEFHSTDQIDATLIVTIWNLGATIGCLIIGPLSELYGRWPVYNVANFFFLAFCIAETQSKSINMVIVLRCLNGLSIASTSLNPSIIGDLFVIEQRGRAQSFMSLMPLMGPVIGPIVGGYITQTKGWRWTFWFAAIIAAAFGIAFLAFYRETYDVIILQGKARRLRKTTGNVSMHSRYDNQNLSATAIVQKAFLRPLRIFTIPIFMLLATATCILNGYIYLVATTITEVFQNTYHFSEGAAGLSFLGLALGMATGALLCSFLLDWNTKRMKALHNGEIKPEWRLPSLIVGFILAPISLFWYGWGVEAHVQYVFPIFGTAVLGTAVFIVNIPVITYLTDTFGTYRASAMSAFTMYRNAVNAVLPLAGPPLYQSLGLGWGNSVLAFVALAMVPIPFILIQHGERMRKRSKPAEWS